MKLLEQLCNAAGPSGREDAIREILIPVINPLCDSVSTDSMGNLIAFKKGTKGERKTMVCAHMDEVGLIIKEITEDGYLKFDTVGGIDPRVLISKGVVTCTGNIKGVIGSKPKHLMDKNEKSADKVSSLFIDIGAQSKKEAMDYVFPGEYAVFDTKFALLSDSAVCGKALDDRAGCYILTRLIENRYNDDMYFVFTVQEEVGCRGAKTASYNISPDRALVIEGTTCSDLATDKDYEFSTKSGKGAAISIFDRGSRADREMVKTLVQTAEERNIPWQYKQTTMGGNDAGAIHISRSGIRTAALSVPCRYIHSPISVAGINDIKACADLAAAFLSKE